MAQREELSVKAENRVGISLLGGNIVGLSARRNRQPRSRLAESCIGPIAPLHWRALSVAAFFQRPAQLADGVLDVVLALRVVVLHPQFFAVVQDRGPTQREVQRRHELGDGIVVHAVAVAVVRPDRKSTRLNSSHGYISYAV